MHMTRNNIYLTILVWILCLSSQAATITEQADNAFKARNYAEAARLYETALKKEKSAETYYNAGNAYFRLGDYPRAILNYERSLRIDPSDEDATHNLALCRTKIADRFDRNPEMFFVTWFKQLAYGHSADTWGNYALCALMASLIGFILFRSGRQLWLRKTGFAIGTALLIVTLSLEILAFLQNHRFRNETKAVIMSKTAFLPDKGQNSQKRFLHEGTTVTILEDGLDREAQVKLPDGNTGWIKDNGLERINR